MSHTHSVEAIKQMYLHIRLVCSWKPSNTDSVRRSGVTLLNNSVRRSGVTLLNNSFQHSGVTFLNDSVQRSGVTLLNKVSNVAV